MDPDDPTRVIEAASEDLPPWADPTTAAAADADEGAALARVRTRMLGLPEAPTQVGRYRVVGRVGQGGMGVVLAAHDDALDRPVAIKILRRELASDAAWRDRFTREAQALARLSHPNVVQVYEVGIHDDKIFIAMELVQGTPLREWARAEPRGWQEIVAVLVGAGAGRSAAHQAGLIHRDFKPDNVIVSAQGPAGTLRARVLDFGVVRFEGDAPRSAATPSGSFAATSGGATRTEAGVVMGTLAYMPPEQRRGEPIDARADQYAFGVTLHELLYGVRPRDAPPAEGSTTGSARRSAEASQHVAQPRKRGVPQWLHAIVTRALAEDPADRFASMDVLLEALRRRGQRQRIAAALGLAGVLALALAGRAAWIARQTAACERETESFQAWWDPARATAERGLLATGVANAAQTWAAAAPRLDAFVDAWKQARVQACDATREPRWRRGAQACLDQRRAALASLAEIWAAATAEDVDGVGPAAASLPPLIACTEPEVAAPTDEAEGSWRAQLFRADAARIAGRNQDAAALARAIETEAGAAELRASAAILLGRIAIEAGDPAEAERHFHDGFTTALAAGRNDIAGEAAGRLAVFVGVQRRYEAFDSWSEIARAAFVQARLPDSDPRTLALAVGAATVASTRGDPARALDMHRAGLDALTAVYGEDHPETWACRRALAIDLAMLGRYHDSAAENREILRVREQVLGPDHPDLADTIFNLGNSLQMSGDLQGAVAMHERARALLLRHQRERHPLFPSVLEGLGGDAFLAGDWSAALQWYDRALAAQQGIAPESFHVARMHGRRAEALVELGRLAEAERAATEAVARYEATVGPDHVDTSMALEMLANTRERRGDAAGAQELLARALRIRVAALGADHPHVAELRGRVTTR